MLTPVELTAADSETEPLLEPALVDRQREIQSRRWKANPYWVMPVVLVVNAARGLILSPRISLFTNIACRAIGTECDSAQVAARAAQVQATFITIMNILCSGTTGLWTQYSERRGRKVVLCVSVAGFIVVETVFVIVSSSSAAIASRAETLVIIGSMFEGIAGGMSVFNGIVHAYVSDCSPDGSRSNIFSIIQGMAFAGLAIGPWISGFLLSYTTLTTYSMFYVALFFHLALLGYIFVMPESLSPKEHPALSESVAHGRSLRGQLKRTVSAFLSPITVFRPRRVDHLTGHAMDYNVTLMGLAMFLYITSTAITPLKYLYGQRTYRWDPQQLGYYMSLLWIVRAANLFFVLPLIVKYLKPKVPITGASTPEEIASELRSDVAFVAASGLSAFTSGGNPALQSLGAVCLFALGYGSESGKLFGAIGVLNAISHSFSASPGLFAYVYAQTVAWSPKTVFLLAAALLYAGVGSLSAIKPRGAVVVRRRKIKSFLP
ncbi:hypothetical protein HMN09_00413500 [Mycena chlorophos]|uniref:MFS general substrate transporter n=1 Tax=Mycena chlorophos TaxID=658473 RepID=A0A8H6TGG4_MYCCL|nr:hypothetical protein HMN09_00413500 [Mycena chlorophos]